MRPALAILAVLLAGCAAKPHRDRALLGVGSYHRHEAHPSLGWQREWDDGHTFTARWRPSIEAFWPGEDPYSSRATGNEWGAFEVEVGIPIGGP